MADMRGILADLADDADVLGGVSLGAHAAAAFASETGWAGGLVAVMPAWTGPPGGVAGLTAHTADEVEALGVDAVLGRIFEESAPGDWVARELRTAWTGTPSPELAHYLRVAAEQPSPDTSELELIRARTVVVALADDPLHPEQVARQWARAIPGATLEVLPRMLDSASELGRPLARLLGAIGSQ
jgi:pimeloyl-ACP methyl ester carboxylesterase